MMKEGQTATALLELRDIACFRGGRLLFEGLRLALGPGEAAVAIGPNGAGKSSLLRIAAGLLRPAAGTVARGGRVALDTEAAALDRDVSLARALVFWATLDGGGGHAMRAGLEALDLAPLAEVPVRLLSTGQRRRAGLARVVASRAPIWLLDEPANGLDSAALGRLTAAMAAHRASGGAILAASHTPLGLDDARTVTL